MPKSRRRAAARALCATSASVAMAAATVAVGVTPAFAATATPASGTVGTTVTIKDATGLTNLVTAPAVQFRTDACAAAWADATASVVSAGNITKTAADTVTFTVPLLLLSPGGAAKAYNICVYGSATSAAKVITTASGTFNLTAPTVTTTVAAGTNGYIVNGTLTGAGTIFATLPSVQFAGSACAPAYSAANGTAATASVPASGTSISIAVPKTATSPSNICFYNTSSGHLLGAATFALQLPSLTLSSSSGASDTTSGITVTSSTATMLGGVTAPGVIFTKQEKCPLYYTASGNVTVPQQNVRKLGNNRMGVTVPILPLTTPGIPQPYQLCIYNGGTVDKSTLLAVAGYTATIVPSPTGIMPDAGPSTGGTMITVTGTDFPTTPGSISATLGGVPLKDITPVNSTSFTATLPVHAPDEGVILMVTTSQGTKALPGAFTYRDAVRVTPNTAPNTTTALDLSVYGTGFMSYYFGPETADAKIFLVRGEYDSTSVGDGERANSPVAECGNILVVSDEELICTLRLDRRLNATADGFFDSSNYWHQIQDVTTRAGSRTIISPSGSFNLSDVGQRISIDEPAPEPELSASASPSPSASASETPESVSVMSLPQPSPSQGTMGNAAGEDGMSMLPPDTFITAVLSRNVAIISSPAEGTSNEGFAVSISGTAVHVLSFDMMTRADSTTISLTTGKFTKADIGRVFGGGTDGIENGTTIISVAPSGRTATLSAPAVKSTNFELSFSTVKDSRTITGSFTNEDVGAVIGPNDRGIPVGTRIDDVAEGFATATLAAPATVTSNASSLSVPVERQTTGWLYPAAPVLEGAYNLTVVSNGSLDASTTDPEYRQSAVTSGSTFTVSAF